MGTTNADVLTGFELAHVAVDCNCLDDLQMASGAININGSHIHIHHCRFFNFGALDVDPIYLNVVTIARPKAEDVFDAVISDCVFEKPKGTMENGYITCVAFTSVAADFYNRACVVRDCYFNCEGVTNAEMTAISANGAVGLFIEQNQIWNVMTGLMIFDGAAADLPVIKDLIVRDNFLYNAFMGVVLGVSTNPGTTPPIGRLAFTGNIIELPTSGTAVALMISAPLGTNPVVNQLIVRQNQIRHLDGAAGSANTLGMTLQSIKAAIIEENLINIGDVPTVPDKTKAITYTSTVQSMKTFNNQSTAGTFVGAWNSTLGRHQGDLVTDIEDMVIAL